MKKAFALCIVVALVGMVGCATEQGGVVTKNVSIHGFSYLPSAITVDSGDTVTWKNNCLLTHTVTDDPSLAKKAGDAVLPAGASPFNSGDLKPGQTFSYTFTTPGTYKYFCIPHENMGMVGKVIVRESATTRPMATTMPIR